MCTFFFSAIFWRTEIYCFFFNADGSQKQIITSQTNTIPETWVFVMAITSVVAVIALGFKDF